MKSFGTLPKNTERCAWTLLAVSWIRIELLPITHCGSSGRGLFRHKGSLCTFRAFSTIHIVSRIEAVWTLWVRRLPDVPSHWLSAHLPPLSIRPFSSDSASVVSQEFSVEGSIEIEVFILVYLQWGPEKEDFKVYRVAWRRWTTRWRNSWQVFLISQHHRDRSSVGAIRGCFHSHQ